MPAQLTFEQFLSDAAQNGEAVNILFEQRLFDLVGVLHKISGALSEALVPHELVGGLAVLVHVEEADPAHAMLTRDVDLMVRREDLDRIKDAAARHGFRFRHSAGLDMLLFGSTDSAKNAVHLLFSGEKVRPNQATPNPPIAPEKKRILGHEVMVIPLAGLVRMKLSAFRLKDQVHLIDLLEVGLIDGTWCSRFPPQLSARLKQLIETRDREA